MGNIAYLDLNSGISGDMFLAALIDLGGDAELLDVIIRKFNFEDVHILIQEENRGIKGKDLVIEHTDQPHRKLSEVLELIEDSNLEERIKKKSIETFRTLGKVESEIHGVKFDELELHEVGMVDSIIDIVGSIALIDDLNIDHIYCSTVYLGCGYTDCEHGTIPVPVPATERLLKGWNINFSEKKGELVTPTGAAILNTMVDQANIPDMQLLDIGVGYGDKKRDEPNALKIFMGEKKNKQESIDVFKFYIDDLSPEKLSYGLEKIRKKAIDVYSTPASGKKGRQGWEIKVLSKKDNFKEIKETILNETSTLGFRVENTKRIVVERKIEDVNTKYGEAKVKISKGNIYPEYESCKKIADKEGLEISKVYELVKKAYKSK